MARYPVVATGTLDLTYKEVTDLLKAREALKEAEAQFYKDRADLVNNYPMKRKDITPAEIEALYDSQLGTEPWKYLARFNTSGSALKTGAYPPFTPTFTWGYTTKENRPNTADVYWVGNYPGTPDSTPTGGYPEIFEANYTHIIEYMGTKGIMRYPGDIEDVDGPWLYNKARGASWVDLIVAQGGYNNGFTNKGSLQNWEHHISTEGEVEYYAAIGEVPYAYNPAGGLTAFEAHMLKLVGDAWNNACKDELDTYKTAYDKYNTEYGSKAADFAFTSSSLSGVWNGYKQDGGDLLFNRPGALNAKLVNEARGLSR